MVDGDLEGAVGVEPEPAARAPAVFHGGRAGRVDHHGDPDGPRLEQHQRERLVGRRHDHGLGPGQDVPLVGLGHRAGHHDVRMLGGLVGDGTDEGHGQVARVAFLVPPEVLGQHPAALVLVDPAEVAEVGPVPEAEEIASPPAGAGRVVDPEPEDDLGARPDGEDVLHQIPLRLGVVDEAVDVPEALAERER